jgi:hypothetical protein
VALSRIKSLADLCILPPDDIDDFATRSPVDLEVVQILETMQSSRPMPIPQISPGDNVGSGSASLNRSNATLSNGLPCPDDYFDAPEDQIDFAPRLDHDDIELFDPCPDEMSLNAKIM